MNKIVFLIFCIFAECAYCQNRNKNINVNGVKVNLIFVEKGIFKMGSSTDEDYDEREHPSHNVRITKNFYIGETEVTQELWTAIMGNNPSENVGNKKPVDSVSWDDCQSFISILNNITGKNFRLPTEAEWEYAAKGGNKSRGYIYSGSNTMDEVGWYKVNSGDKIQKDTKSFSFTNDNNNRTHDVKTKHPNELGIYDMSGNVSEWCEDGYSDYSSESQIDPKGVPSNKFKVKKGGDYNSRSRHCYTTFRVGFETDFYTDTYGFRLAIDE